MTPTKYKVVSSTKKEFSNIELYLTFEDPQPGQGCEVFGHKFTITQTGKLTVLSSDNWVLTLQLLEEPRAKEWGDLITDPDDLRFNFEVDVFLEKKTVRVQETDRLTMDGGVSMKALALFLINNWRHIQAATDVLCPFEWHDDDNLLYMFDSWNLDGLESVMLTRNGSFTRYNESGRCVPFDG